MCHCDDGPKPGLERAFLVCYCVDFIIDYCLFVFRYAKEIPDFLFCLAVSCVRLGDGAAEPDFMV